MQTKFPFDSVRTLTFTQRPRTLSANLRPLYRISLLLLVLRLNCRLNTASFLKLQFFNWMLKNDDLMDYVSKMSRTQSMFSLKLVHMDPMVNLSLRYAFAEKLIEVTAQSKYMLTEKGILYADTINQKDNDLLKTERSFLAFIGMSISEVKLQRDLGLL